MQSALVLPSHEAVLARGLPGIRAFLAMLLSIETIIEEVAFLILDLRSTAGATAGVQLLGQPWVERHLASDAFPVVVVPLRGRDDIARMVDLLAPRLIPQLGPRSRGSVNIVILNDRGEGALVLFDALDLLNGAG